MWEERIQKQAIFQWSAMPCGNIFYALVFVCYCGSGGVSTAFVLLRFLTSEHELSLSASALLFFRFSAFCRCLLLVSFVFLLPLLFCFSSLLLLCFLLSSSYSS